MKEAQANFLREKTVNYSTLTRTCPWRLAVLAVIIGLSVYFRVVWTQSPAPHLPQLSQAMAATLVLNSIKGQIRPGLAASHPNLSIQAFEELVEKSAQDAAKNDPDEFKKAMVSVMAHVSSAGPQDEKAQPYLLEADPYYYYYLAQKIQTAGALSSKFKDGLFYNPLRLAPEGSWDWMTLHPYLGYYCHQVIKLFDKDQDLMQSVSWVPVVLSALVAGVFFALCRILHMELLPTFSGAFTLMLSPIFLQRSAFGWFDTDPYNYLFPILALCTLFNCIDSHDTKNRIFQGVLGGFLTGLYALFWAGWPFLMVLIFASAVTVGAVEYIRTKKVTQNAFTQYLIAYLISAVLFLFIFITPKSFLNVIYNGLVFLPKFSVSKFESWPSVFLTVGETKSISIQKLVFLTGNYGAALVALIGLVFPGIYFLKVKNVRRLYQWLIVTVFTVPLFVLSLKTERFAVLFVLPFSLLVVFGAEWLITILTNLQASNLKRAYQNLLTKAACLIIILLIVPMGIVQANLVATRISPIMNSVWYQALTDIRDSTPQNSIIYSWWPPGYFIISVANRRALVDGGTQERPQSYWIAKALLSASERESAGIFRMLATGGNKPMEFLQAKGMDLAAASKLIIDLAPLSRQAALDRLPGSLSESEKSEFLNLTHGTAIDPGYVLLYQDLIEQNLAVTLMSEWDFKKANEVERQDAYEKKKAGFSLQSRNNYVDKMLRVTGNVLKYWPESSLNRQDGDRLFFKDGVRVDLKTKDTEIIVPEKQINGKPRSIFYYENGNLIETEIAGAGLDVSVLLIEREGLWSSVVADRKLIRSMLFRCYYLDGAGLTLFKMIIKKQDVRINNQVSVFQINWDSILAEDYGGE